MHDLEYYKKAKLEEEDMLCLEDERAKEVLKRAEDVVRNSEEEVGMVRAETRNGEVKYAWWSTMDLEKKSERLAGKIEIILR